MGSLRLCWIEPIHYFLQIIRDVYLLATAAEDEESTVAGTRTGIQGWIDCFEKAQLKDTIFCGGVTEVGEIAGNAVLETALTAGKNI